MEKLKMFIVIYKSSQLGKKCKVEDMQTKSFGHTNFPSCPVQSRQSIPEPKLFPPINKSKVEKDANFWKIDHACLPFQRMHSLNWPLHQFSKIPASIHLAKKLTVS